MNFDVDDDLVHDGSFGDAVADLCREVGRAEQRRVERALVGAIRAGYDGLDVHRPSPADPHRVGIQSIEPWHYPEPDAANGARTTRYTWDWFSDDELAEICATRKIPEGLIGE